MAVPSPSPASARKGGLTRSPAGNYLSSAISIPNLRSNTLTSSAGPSSSSSSNTQNQGQGQGQGMGSSDYMIRSSSAISSSSSSSQYQQIPSTSPNPRTHPGLGKRRSTDASSGGGLDYYWSSLAGAGASSSSSSLAFSSSPSSNIMLNPLSASASVSTSQSQNQSPNQIQTQNHLGVSPVGSFERDSKNVGDLRTEELFTHGMGMSFSPSSNEDHINMASGKGNGNGNVGTNRVMVESPTQSSQSHTYSHSHSNSPEEKTPRQPDFPSPSIDRPNPLSTTKALNISYPSTTLPLRKDDLSPGGWSENSRYSNTDEANSAPPSASSSHLSAPAPWRSRNRNGNGEGDPGDESSDSNYSPIGLNLPGNFDFEDALTSNQEKRGLLDLSLPSRSETTQDYDRYGLDREARASVQSNATYRAHQPPLETIVYKTPTIPSSHQGGSDALPASNMPLNRNRGNTPRSGRTSPVTTPQITTPKRSSNSRNPSGQHTPTSASFNRQASGLGFDMPQIGSTSGSISPTKPISSAASSPHGSAQDPSQPNSAPALKTSFNGTRNNLDVKEELDDGKDTLVKADRRSTLPATTSIGSVESASSTSKENLLSPDKYVNRSGAITPSREPSGERRGSTPSPNRSPEPPPRSALRTLPNATNIDAPSSKPPSRRTSSPQSISQTLPVITHTPHSPMPSPDRPSQPSANLDKPQPKRPDRSPDRQHSPIFPSSATINDLTDMLGGAIDAIGLIDSRDTPPPTISEPSKKDKPAHLKLEPAAEVLADEKNMGPMTPTSLPQRGTSLPGLSLSSAPSTNSLMTLSHQPQNASSYPPQAVQNKRTQPELRQKASSIFSFASKEQTQSQSPTLSISVRPWPAAMLYGNIKSLKHSGDRAKGYARAINELSRSESGLREWCIASANQINRAGPPKQTALSSLGVRSNSVPSAIPLPYQLSPYDPNPNPHQRNVSAGSEFPMRADSYTAREISQRVLDPEDQPTSLPPNLPYPQLQQQQNYTSSGGLKPSQSMQSVSSFASMSTKKGFFSAIKKGSKKESLSLGPPTGTGYTSANAGAGAGAGAGISKKDVRGLPISSPRSASPQKSGAGTPTSTTASGVLGPRGPRSAVGGGTYTPPPTGSGSAGRSSLDLGVSGRSSLDTGLSKISISGPPRNSSRGSLDGLTSAMNASASSSVPPPRSSLSIPPISASASAAPPQPRTPREDDIKTMSDILPHVEKSVLRSYLARYGDTMNAIGAYLEDEKNGRVIRS
ncbi:uncharacterized protein I303_102688 [Kwoniella dejecticola CBS 10117]|uniref:CUE domain-containing protein n=1 Tax=Kwoniella dejecticola CBS 10117 TaxID=1296121 RepID=A0A1A6A9F4_9TREE|nr:uncharacterized protein I303_02704 [Kwoniella dejecticola CBS 10117]OBR86692.1 hypothetical protein I303_02704 [Kwoniella dejecticola CBS 10117]